jgi:hypothetical protein
MPQIRLVESLWHCPLFRPVGASGGSISTGTIASSITWFVVPSFSAFELKICLARESMQIFLQIYMAGRMMQSQSNPSFARFQKTRRYSMRKILSAIFLMAVCSLLAAQQALNNESVIKLVKAGLSDDIIVSTINGSAGSYNTSADGIIALKNAGATDKVITAIVLKASGAAPAGVAPAVGGKPAGIDEVGAYYKDKSGTWVSLMPEIVNFKSGGALKSMLTNGIVKGDLNGHVTGKSAKLTLTFPVVLAVYVPEGTAISEYQLLRLRPNGDSREFRSVTGGVVHVSGGATRDAVEFQADKIASRVYQISLPVSLGKGEYGLLPPGAQGSANLGSSGKIYAVSIPE